MTIDLLAIGETMALVAPERGRRLELGAPVILATAGAESNVAAGCAGLGLHAAWYGRIGDDALGRLVVGALAERGVDLSSVETDPVHPTGAMFKDPSAEGSAVSYYRSGSAASHMDAADLDGLPEARLVHLSGITPALSASCHALAEAVVRERRLGGPIVSFDVNHRAALWPDPSEAATTLRALARAADVVFVGRDEAERIWGTTTAEEVRAHLPEPAHLVVKDADREAVEFDGDRVVRVPSEPVDVVEHVGAGDGFAAGWLSAFLSGAPPSERLSLGHRVAAAVLRSATDLADPEALAALADSSPGLARPSARN